MYDRGQFSCETCKLRKLEGSATTCKEKKTPFGFSKTDVYEVCLTYPEEFLAAFDHFVKVRTTKQSWLRNKKPSLALSYVSFH